MLASTITDVCLLTDDVERLSSFYRDEVGLTPRMRNENFADFVFPTGARLAMWAASHVADELGIELAGARKDRFSPIIACGSERAASLRDPEGFAVDLGGDSSDLSAGGSPSTGVRRLQLAVANTDESKAFYTALGFGPVSDGANGALATSGPTGLVLRQDSDAERGPQRLMGAIEFAAGSEVDELYSQLVSAGVDVIAPPQQWPWGARALYAWDPDGFLWEAYAWTEQPYTW